VKAVSESIAYSGVALYVYYKVPQAQASMASGWVQRMQAAMRQEFAQLQTQLMQRSDAASQANGSVTWMEVYRHPHGVNTAMEARLQAMLSTLPADLLGERHTERFCDLATHDASAQRG
jgi:hypothetical protein